jgi:hypothetical protein
MNHDNKSPSELKGLQQKKNSALGGKNPAKNAALL